mgnify:CR=1 FL=1
MPAKRKDNRVHIRKSIPLDELAQPPKVNKQGRPRNHILSRLSRKQEKFGKELVSNDGMITHREAAIRAGYPAGSAHSRAYDMTNPHKSPHIVHAIKKYRAELDEKYSITFGRHIRDLQKIRDAALEDGAYSAAVQAEYRRGQAQGDIYVSKSEIRHGSIDSMSKEEVLKALKEMKELNDSDLIDITPSEDADRSGVLSATEGSSKKRTS